MPLHSPWSDIVVSCAAFWHGALPIATPCDGGSGHAAENGLTGFTKRERFD